MQKICKSIIKTSGWTFRKGKHDDGGQIGFRKGKSCVLNLLWFCSRAMDMVCEREGWADCLYLKLKKSSWQGSAQNVDPETSVGERKGSQGYWMNESLSMGREMRMVMWEEKSNWKRVESGVSQGSFLALIMFIIYINDMLNGIKSCMSLLYKWCKVNEKSEDRKSVRSCK